MSTEDQNQGNEKSPEERIEEIKAEASEDASSYYEQGSSGEKGITEEEFNQPIPPVDEEEEEMSLLKAVAFLGFGMASLAIIFILFFIRDLGNKVGDVDAAVATLEQKFGPLKQEMTTGFTRLNGDVAGLKDKFGSYERMMAVMELKRAKVAIQEVTGGSTPELKAHSAQVVASIDSLLTELGAGDPGAAPAMAAPAAEAAPAHAEPAPAEHAEPEPAPEPMAEAAPAEEAPVGSIELSESGASEDPAGDDSGGGDDGEEDDEDEDDE